MSRPIGKMVRSHSLISSNSSLLAIPTCLFSGSSLLVMHLSIDALKETEVVIVFLKTFAIVSECPIDPFYTGQ